MIFNSLFIRWFLLVRFQMSFLSHPKTPIRLEISKILSSLPSNILGKKTHGVRKIHGGIIQKISHVFAFSSYPHTLSYTVQACGTQI